MSEKLLSGACDDCPMRRKINCDEAEAVMTITHKIPYTASTGKVLYMKVTPNDPIDYYSFELSGNVTDPDERRLEIRTLRTEEFATKADVAAEAVVEQAKSWQVDENDLVLGGKSKINIQIANSMHEIGAQILAQKAKQASLKESLAESIADCEGPEKDADAFFLRRKKCGADILGRTISRYNMTKRNEEAELLKQHGALWTTPERLGKFKPIR